jgi:rare lipoprotein A
MLDLSLLRQAAVMVGLTIVSISLAPICSAQPTNSKATDGRRVQIGDASWYGTQHQGRTTASGEAFDPRSLTAAHPSLPLDSTVRVTNLKNGLWVDVRVNDRGPFKGRRVIDLSAKAAETIGLKRRGVGKVKVEPLQPQPQPAVYHPLG